MKADERLGIQHPIRQRFPFYGECRLEAWRFHLERHTLKRRGTGGFETPASLRRSGRRTERAQYVGNAHGGHANGGHANGRHANGTGAVSRGGHHSIPISQACSRSALEYARNAVSVVVR